MFYYDGVNRKWHTFVDSYKCVASLSSLSLEAKIAFNCADSWPWDNAPASSSISLQTNASKRRDFSISVSNSFCSFRHYAYLNIFHVCISIRNTSDWYTYNNTYFFFRGIQVSISLRQTCVQRAPGFPLTAHSSLTTFIHQLGISIQYDFHFDRYYNIRYHFKWNL